MPYQTHNQKIFFSFTLSLLLSSCGGSSSGDGSTATATDITAPTITLTGPETQNIEINTPYIELGATAVDNADGDISSNITIDSIDVDTTTLGNYSVTYGITDASGNINSQTRTITVHAIDTTAPVITLLGKRQTGLTINDTYTELGVTIIDNIDNNISAVITGSVDTSTLGSYAVFYNAMDAKGNLAAQLTRTVTIYPATTRKYYNDTGVTKGGNYPNGNNSTCIGETIEEQDCSFGRDAEFLAGTLTKIGGGNSGYDFTKLDSDGIALDIQSQSYALNPWACVRDNHTGLIWEIKNTIIDNLHYNETEYRWGGKTSQLLEEHATVYDDWDVLVDGSNNESLCGFSDWRVPNRNELLSMVDLNETNPTNDENYFPNTYINQASFLAAYWTSSAYAQLSGDAWSLSFKGGGGYRTDNRSHFKPVRLVRGNGL